jgi:hypothetical protein
MPKEDSERYRDSYTFTKESLLLGGISLILSATFNDLESLSKLFITADTPTAAAKPVINTAYKRQISKAIPRNKRPNIPNNAFNKAPAAAP